MSQRTKHQKAIDRDVFVYFCPIPGMWGLRLFKFMKKDEIVIEN